MVVNALTFTFSGSDFFCLDEDNRRQRRIKKEEKRKKNQEIEAKKAKKNQPVMEGPKAKTKLAEKAAKSGLGATDKKGKKEKEGAVKRKKDSKI